jgi:hypothetical protein
VALTTPGVNVTVDVAVTTNESVVSVAEITTVPALVDFTVPVILPDESVVPDGCTIVTLPEVAVPEVRARLTALPLTGFPLASFNVTVIVDVVDPSAVTDDGLAATTEVPAFTAPAVEVIDCVAEVRPVLAKVKV